jgi:hypothetical protein
MSITKTTTTKTATTENTTNEKWIAIYSSNNITASSSSSSFYNPTTTTNAEVDDMKNSVANIFDNPFWVTKCIPYLFLQCNKLIPKKGTTDSSTLYPLTTGSIYDRIVGWIKWSIWAGNHRFHGFCWHTCDRLILSIGQHFFFTHQ